ncbi:FAD-dependent thymidylate synthase [[Clostridium] sordellii]|uniref:FAD-dependent thymidylate synthase n=1 Tax=Paraclostridium sordellii TaxID=1505 RepID=UPI0005E1302E|nr:FAD-dependent thymidylate synthase [Paeniclostridium sordellii]CEQ01655.1 FAD-dependent thymidylate synthase [[Clostridium] sordellii] [Paeniclostridium sordellii]
METKLNIKLLSHTMNPELIISVAGKLCYSPSSIKDLMEKQTPEAIEKFVNMLVSMGHESPLEHVSFTFAIEGVSRSLTHQLVRHRIASYSQQSQRYVNLDKSFEYVVPKRIGGVKYIKQKFEKAMNNAFESYVRISRELLEFFIYDYLVEEKEIYSPDTPIELLEDVMKDKYKDKYRSFIKMAIEDARSVLPNACETKIICTMNLRTLINFCKHRCCRRAQGEIHDLAWGMVDLIEEISPLLSRMLGASCQFGKCPEGDMCCGNPYPKKK